MMVNEFELLDHTGTYLKLWGEKEGGGGDAFETYLAAKTRELEEMDALADTMYKRGLGEDTDESRTLRTKEDYDSLAKTLRKALKTAVKNDHYAAFVEDASLEMCSHLAAECVGRVAEAVERLRASMAAEAAKTAPPPSGHEKPRTDTGKALLDKGDASANASRSAKEDSGTNSAPLAKRNGSANHLSKKTTYNKYSSSSNGKPCPKIAPSAEENRSANAVSSVKESTCTGDAHSVKETACASTASSAKGAPHTGTSSPAKWQHWLKTASSGKGGYRNNAASSGNGSPNIESWRKTNNKIVPRRQKPFHSVEDPIYACYAQYLEH